MASKKPLTKKTKKEKAEQEDLWSRKSEFAIAQKDHGRVLKTIGVIFLIIVILVLAVAIFFTYQNLRKSKNETENVKKELSEAKKEIDERLEPLEEKIKAEEKAREEAEKKRIAEEKARGAIEGSLSYPSSYIPKTMKVCAENIETKEQTCTQEQLVDKKYTYGIGYKIETKPGKYHVFASDPSWGEYRAYYSDYVVCGLNSSCASHSPVEVEVKAKQIINKMNKE